MVGPGSWSYSVLSQVSWCSSSIKVFTSGLLRLVCSVLPLGKQHFCPCTWSVPCFDSCLPHYCTSEKENENWWNIADSKAYTIKQLLLYICWWRNMTGRGRGRGRKIQEEPKSERWESERQSDNVLKYKGSHRSKNNGISWNNFKIQIYDNFGAINS